MVPLFKAFSNFSREVETIGRLLTGYSILELDLMHCLQVQGNFDSTIRAIFGKRGETARIKEAQARGRILYKTHRLTTEFDRAIDALRHCLKIRNQYAHWIWWDYSGKLALANIEDVAHSKKVIVDLGDLDPEFVDLRLLREQEAYFQYTDNLINYVNFEGRDRAGLIRNPYKKPPFQVRPRLWLP